MITFNSTKMSIKKVTCWERWNPKKDRWKYNHFENGWVNDDCPNPIVEDSEAQQNWKNQTWRKQYKFYNTDRNKIYKYSVVQLEKMITDYINGDLSEEKSTELWAFVVQHEDLLEMLEMQVNLAQLRKQKEN